MSEERNPLDKYKKGDKYDAIRSNLLEYSNSKINQQAVYLLTFVIGSFQLLNQTVLEILSDLFPASSHSIFIYLMGFIILNGLMIAGRLFYWTNVNNGVFIACPRTEEKMICKHKHLAKLENYYFSKLWMMQQGVEDFVNKNGLYKDRRYTLKNKIGNLFNGGIRILVILGGNIAWLLIWLSLNCYLKI